MITIHFNSELISLEKSITVKELLIEKNKLENFFAVILNKKFIPQSHYTTTVITDGDTVEIVLPMQGG
ncbi:MAG: thiamine biosynthesis protein ThiS [Gammaproteobacteria bacterium RIFCSPHIGHO2_12_FULL_41_20]|nr:MAG: thiamine biosynthesis protein ThiS [Gammaproteobacteria bacterium RIFCSPHIGHO2_12_FULL_41_20]